MVNVQNHSVNGNYEDLLPHPLHRTFKFLTGFTRNSGVRSGTFSGSQGRY